MPSLRPNLNTIIKRITNDANARYDKTFLRRSDMNTYIRVLAGASHEMYSAIDFGRKQIFTETAETLYLERRGRLFDIYRKLATYATGMVQFTWESVTTIPAGTLLQDGAGNQFETTDAVTSSGYAPISAVNTGSAYNLAQGTEFTLVSAIAGVSGATATSAITGGTDAESDESLRARILARTQKPPRTGTADDYVAWAKEVSGVTRAWCYPREMGAGTVTVRIMSDGLTPDGFPTESLIAATQAYISSKTDVLATTYVESPIAQPVDFTLTISPDNTAMRQRVRERLQELFTDEAIPGGKIYLSHIHSAISEVTDEVDHVILSPVADIEATSNAHLLTLGDITWAES